MMFIRQDIENLFKTDILAVFSTIADCVPGGIIIAKAVGEFVLWNKLARDILGKTAEDIPTDEWAKHYGVYNADETPCKEGDLPLVQALNGNEIRNCILLIKNPKGEKKWIECHAKPITNQDNMVIGGVIVFVDVSSRETLAKQTEMLNKIITSLKGLVER
jgi:PAS domain S-box-containing protein